MKTFTNHPLKHFTSLKVGGPAETLFLLQDNDTLIDILKKHKQHKIWIFGDGSNSLISDKGLKGVVIINKSDRIQLSGTTITVDSGVNWDELVKYSIKKNLYGFELMSGIPGSVGAAVIGNIAAYGQKIADTFVSANIYDTKSSQTRTISKQEMDFEYRNSAVSGKQNHIVLDATFKLSALPTMQLEYESALQVAKELRIVPHNLKDRRKIIIKTRERAGSLLSKDSHATAGSFFKNPIISTSQVDAILKYDEANISKERLLRQNKLHSGESVRVSAAHVLLAAGFNRGQTWGNVRLHPDHILKIENTGNASAQEIHDVVHFIIGTTQSRLGIKLEPEVRFIGDFN